MIIALLFLLLIIPGFAFAKIKEEEKKKTYDLKDWVDGPVRYISTYDEVKQFKSLKTDQERNHFIYKFWRRRDPSPLTISNEFRIQFWDRVVIANQHFDESSKPGWKTDRGKIFIMAGPPNEIEPIPDPEPSLRRSDMRSASVSGHRGLERWIYEGFPSLKASNYIVVAFYRDATGEYRISYNPAHFAKVAPGIIPSSDNYPDPQAPAKSDTQEGQTDEEDTRAEEAEQQLDGAIARTEEIEKLNAISQFTYDLAEIADTPFEEDLLQERIRTFEFFEQMQGSIDFTIFQDANSHPYLNLSIQTNLKNYYRGDISDETTIPMSLFGNLQETGYQQNEFLFTSEGVQELLTGKINLYSGTINIPPFRKGQIALSDPILASKIESAEEDSQKKVSPIPGNLIVTPKVHPSYSQEEEFYVYFQIYEVENDPSTGKPDLDLFYQFYIWDGRQYQKIGESTLFQNVDAQERGWSFPLGKWPPGKFKLEITAKDNLSGFMDSKEIFFDITGQ
jgi:GWxTD domain-containing protein